MCYNPLHIRNQAWPRRIAALPYIDVPCGNCLECQDKQKLDYLIRCIAVYKNLPADKWSVFFTTLTFNEESVPVKDFYHKIDSFQDGCITLDDGSHWIYDGKVRCFDHSILHTFTKSLRQFFRRKMSLFEYARNPETGRMKKYYKYVPSNLESLHYLITCEFGEDASGTHRPHYHAIFFVPGRWHWIQFRDLLSRFWKYGFTKSIKIAIQDNQFYERSDYASFQYVCKYVNKNSGYLPDVLKIPGVCTDVPLSKVLPRVFTSNGFGSFLERDLTEDNYKKGKIRYDISGKWREYLIPNYFLRRRFINYEQSVDNTVRYVHSTPFCPSHYENFRKVTTVSLPTQEYLDIQMQRRVDKIKTDYLHVNSSYLSSSLFRGFLEENGFPYEMDDVIKSFASLSAVDFCCRYLKAVQFPEACVVRSDKYSERTGEDIFNLYVPDTKYRSFQLSVADGLLSKLAVDHKYNTLWLFDDLHVQCIASLIDFWHQFENDNKQMRAIARRKRAFEYYKQHNIKKSC